MTAIVQRVVASGADTSPRNLVFGASVTSGNSVIVCVWMTSDTDLDTITSVTDDQSNTYTLDYAGTEVSGNSFRLYRSHNITNAPGTISVNHSGILNCNFSATEASGLDDAVDVASGTANGNGTSATLALTGSADHLLIGAMRVSGGPTVTGSDGATVTPDPWAYAIDDVGGTSIGGTWSGSADWILWAVSYAPAPSSGVSIPIAMRYYDQMRNR